MSRSLAAAFTTEKNRIWARPFNSAIFRFGGAVGDIFVASFDATIGANAHKGVVSRWGDWSYLVSPRDGVFQSRSMNLDLINHPIFTGPKRFTDLWSGIGVEGVEVDVYQNFKQVGSSTILQELLFAGVMRPGKYSPDSCALELASISEKYLDKKEISFPIDQTDFPNADIDDIGKRANVIYGSVKKAVAHAVVAGIVSVLRADMTSSQTTVPIHDDYHDLLPASGKVQIGDEKIDYTGKGGVAGSRTLTGLTRGSGSTPAQKHKEEDAIFQWPTEFIYLAAGHELKALSKVYVEKDGKVKPIDAADVTIELANTTLVSGKTLAVIKFPTKAPSMGRKNLVAINDGIGVSDTIGVSQTNSEAKHIQEANGVSVTLASGGTSQSAEITWTQAKTKSSGQFKYSVPWKLISGNQANLQIGVDRHLTNATEADVVFYETDSGGNVITDIGSPGVWLDDHWHSDNDARRFKLFVAKLVGTASPAVTVQFGMVSAEYSISVAVTKTGAASKTGSATLSADSTAERVIGDRVLFDCDGYKDDVSGTYTGVASALIEKPADVLHHLARVVGEIPSSRVDGASFTTARADAPASYKFSGILTERTAHLKELFLALGAQCRTQIDWPVDKLVARFLKSTYGAISKTLTEENVMQDGSGHTSLRVWRTDAEEIVNAVNLYYGRQWDVARGRDAFKKVTKASDATSITKYTKREDEDRFWFDFVAEDNATMADDLRDFWLARLKEPARRGAFDCKLDQYELLPGDIMGLHFHPKVGGADHFDGLDGLQKFLVEEAALTAGNARDNQPTRMSLVLREVS